LLLLYFIGQLVERLLRLNWHTRSDVMVS
jgi:hypothetical protein